MKLRELMNNIDKYFGYDVIGTESSSSWSIHIYEFTGYNIEIYMLKDLEVVKIDHTEKEIVVEGSIYDVENAAEAAKKKVRTAIQKRKAETFLATPLAQRWLKKMKYTTRKDEYGNEFVFLAIKCGYKKLGKESFQTLCDSLCWRHFGGELRMHMWIGGEVNWTMFYERPDHVNGRETYFCGIVGEDNFSPEDFDRNHEDFSFSNLHRRKQEWKIEPITIPKEYDPYVTSGRFVEVDVLPSKLWGDDKDCCEFFVFFSSSAPKKAEIEKITKLVKEAAIKGRNKGARRSRAERLLLKAKIPCLANGFTVQAM